jgi:hypothetical protein
MKSITNFNGGAIMKYVSKRDSGKVVYVHFEDIFNQDITSINEFSLSKKRNFVNICDTIVEAMEINFEENENIAMSYAELSCKIKGDEYYEQIDFIEDIKNKLIDEDTKERINNYVESTYDIDLDKQTVNSKNVNEELEFTDNHAKIILKTSMAMKIIIPLVTDYINKYQIDKMDNLFFDIFSDLFQKFSTEDVDILNKIFKFIHARITLTKYSDKIIWSYLKNLSLDSDIITRQFHKKIIVNIIPKMENNRSIVSYLHAVLKNLIKYQFTVNFPINYKPLNLNQTNSEGLTDFDKIEVSMVRSDESMNIIIKQAIKYEINKLVKENNIRITKKEFEFYSKNIVINKLQTVLLFLLFSKNLGSYRNLYFCNYDQYIILCIIAKKILEKKGLKIISKYITAKPERYLERKTINKKEFIDKLINSKKYERIFKIKYKYVIANLIDSAIIMKYIATMKTNKFYDLDYNESLKDEETTKVLIDEKIESISDEFLDFIEMV